LHLPIKKSKNISNIIIENMHTKKVAVSGVSTLLFERANALTTMIVRIALFKASCPHLGKGLFEQGIKCYYMYKYLHWGFNP
jgi:hypothetical protein